MGTAKWLGKLASVGGWILVAVSLPWGLWWYFHIPTPGKGGILLAFVATIMPLVWDDMQAIGRAGLIFTLVILFAVEYRAIDKEHTDYANEQKEARAEERRSFQELLDTQERNVSRLLEQEDHHFAQTFREFLIQDKHENARFYELLGKQESLFKRQEELSKSLGGRLLPGNQPFTHLCEAPKGSVVVLYGDHMGSIVSTFPHLVVASRHLGPFISLDRSWDGSIRVLMDVRSEDRKIIVRLDEDGFVVNRSNSLEVKTDRSSLSVIDEYGDEVLNIRYLNPREISVSGTLQFGKEKVSLTPANISGVCLDTAGMPGVFDLLVP
jgi:hypothetical protein